MTIPLIRHIKSSISLKLFIAFLVVVMLSLLALLLTLNSLNKTREAQDRLTQEALPLLRVSKDFSLTLFEHLVIVEQITSTPSNHKSLSQQLKEREESLKIKLDELQKLTGKAIDTNPIA